MVILMKPLPNYFLQAFVLYKELTYQEVSRDLQMLWRGSTNEVC